MEHEVEIKEVGKLDELCPEMFKPSDSKVVSKL